MSWVRKQIEKDPDFGVEIEEEALVESTMDLIESLMEHANARVSRAELARRLGMKKPAVTQLLNGNQNITLRRLARIVHALGFKIKPLAAEPLTQRMPITGLIFKPTHCGAYAETSWSQAGVSWAYSGKEGEKGDIENEKWALPSRYA